MNSMAQGGSAALLLAAAWGAQAQPIAVEQMTQVYRSPQVAVWAAPLPLAQSKVRALPIQVLIDGQGVPLALPGGIQATSALVQAQVRCPSGVWAVETLTAFDGQQGTGAVRVAGQAPAGQLSWNRLAENAQAKPGLLMVWLEMAATQLCAGRASAAAP